MAPPVLYFQSINPAAPRTLLLLHGSFSSHHEWDLVRATPHLAAYHLLIPDLPAHGHFSSAAIPLALPSTGALLAQLIAQHAQGGQAGLVGMSLGGYISIYLAATRPERVDRELGVFVSGCGRPFPPPRSLMCWATGFVMFAAAWLVSHLPRFVTELVRRRTKLDLSEELWADVKTAASYRLGQELSVVMSEDAKSGKTWKELSGKVEARSLVVAGVLVDSEEECRVRGRELRAGNEESRAFKVEGVRHAWHLQNPDLFARGIKAWMERGKLPDEFVSLD